MKPIVCQLKPVPRIDETQVAQGYTDYMSSVAVRLFKLEREHTLLEKRHTYAQGHDRYHITGGDLYHRPLLGSAVETVPTGEY